MGTDYTNQLRQRPELVQRITYTSTPEYTSHKSYEDKLAILVCQIKIWSAKAPDWFNIPKASDCTVIRECESIEVSDSAKDLIAKAVVKFPRGTVISQSAIKDKKVTVGNALDNTEHETTIKDATQNGDIMSDGASQYTEDAVSTTPIAMNYDDKGLIDYNRTKTEAALLSPNDVATGQRIEIRCGYAYSETEFNEMNTADSHKNLDIIFTGFITSISASTPLELECENMGHVLSTVSSPNISAGATLKVSDFLDESGYNLLQDTGIKLAESSKKCDITVSGGTISDKLTVADVLSAWSKSGVLCRMVTLDNGSVELRVGYVYYAGSGGHELPNKDKKYITYKENDDKVLMIQSDWDVASDRLTMKNVDKKYLAIEAHGRTQANQEFKFTIRKDPNSDDDGWQKSSGEEGEFQTVNKKEIEARKKSKVINGTQTNVKVSGIKNKVPMSRYTVIPYVSTTNPVTEERLMEEAKQFWAKSNPNGISGSLELFGDLFIQPTDIVGYIDVRHPGKNGYYYVESVNTKFGVSGYRREIKIPFKISSFKKNIQIIR